MIKIACRTLLFVYFVAGFLISTSAAADNACVACHQALAPSPERAHDFSEWGRSLHSRTGITCEKCHGGNPNETTSQKAHEGIIKSNHQNSPLYFTQIPETCGKCHAAELTEFKKSYHYSELKRSGHGPNCITCHGSMAIGIPEPRQLEQNCSLCHQQRSSASEALVTLNLAGSFLKKWETAFVEAKVHGVTTASDETTLNEQKKLFQNVQRKWHSFAMNDIIAESKKIVAVAKEGLQSLKLKKGAN